jgi:hypothetical protein
VNRDESLKRKHLFQPLLSIAQFIQKTKRV